MHRLGAFLWQLGRSTLHEYSSLQVQRGRPALGTRDLNDDYPRQNCDEWTRNFAVGFFAPINMLHQISYLQNRIFAREKKLERLIS